MLNDVNSQLIEENAGLLRQVLSLLGRMDDAIYATSPQGFAPHRVGGHLRHILEFYECFLDGLPSLRIDYDRRKRDEIIEKSRQSAEARIGSTISHLSAHPLLRHDEAVAVRMENSDADVYFTSSIRRELQALSSHTIHHLALIAVTLRLHGFEVDSDFGMSPSTLRYQAMKVLSEAA
jgi:hypothetical protein